VTLRRFVRQGIVHQRGAHGAYKHAAHLHGMNRAGELLPIAGTSTRDKE